MNRWIAPTFDEFGRSMGIEGLAPDRDGGLSLLLDGERHLAFQVLDDAVLMLLAQPVGHGDSLGCKLRALALCHLRHGWNLPVRAGLSRDGRLVFMSHIPVRQFLLPVVEQAFDLLTRLHAQARH